MSPERCYVRTPTPLPAALRQVYDQLSAPQCTNITYIYTYVMKLLPFISADTEISEIVCNLNKAITNLQHIHVSMIIKPLIEAIKYI